MKKYTIAFLILNILSCTSQQKSNKTDIEIVHMIGDSDDNICYWINDQKQNLQILSDESYTWVGDIFVIKNDVYVAAYSNGPFYWKNGQKNILQIDGQFGGRARGVCVSDNDIYISGEGLTGEPCFWKNNQPHYLPNQDGHLGSANKIIVKDDNIYISGYTEFYNDTYNLIYTPCYWMNADRIDLSKPLFSYDGLAFSMYVNSNDVYVCGYISDRKYDIPCYWKNGERIELSNPMSDACALEIFVHDNSVYIAGYVNENNKIIPCYWMNNKKINLSNINGGRALTVFVTNNNIYIGGFVVDNDGIQIPCYWKNEVRQDIGTGGRVSSIYIIN
jgi:hypothetical protein